MVPVSVSVSAVPIPTLLTLSHVLPYHSRQKQYVALPDYSIVSPFFLAPEFLGAIRSVNPPSRWKILVIDEHSQELLNFVLKKFDILEENVTRELALFSPMPNSPVGYVKPSHRIHNRSPRGAAGTRRSVHAHAHLGQRRPHHPRFFRWTTAVRWRAPLLHRWSVHSSTLLSSNPSLI